MPTRICSLIAFAIIASTGFIAVAAPGPQRGTGTWIDAADASDLDLDGRVDDADFVLFSFQYDAMECSAPTMPEDCSADVNHDGVVDDADFVIFAREYNRTFAVVA